MNIYRECSTLELLNKKLRSRLPNNFNLLSMIYITKWLISVDIRLTFSLIAVIDKILDLFLEIYQKWYLFRYDSKQFSYLILNFQLTFFRSMYYLYFYIAKEFIRLGLYICDNNNSHKVFNQQYKLRNIF